MKPVILMAAMSLVAGVSAAHASTLGPDDDSTTVLYSQSSLVQGNASSVTTLDVPSSGELFLTLTDLDYPSTFSALNFSLSSSQTDLVGLAQPGTLTLNVPGPMTLYADVFATSQASSNLGLYNLTATFLSAAPVPLPAGGLLLGSGLVLLMGRFLRKGNAPAVLAGA